MARHNASSADAENLVGREREGADALVDRIERRFECLQAHREKRAL